jgi:hypothetical protein
MVDKNEEIKAANTSSERHEELWAAWEAAGYPDEFEFKGDVVPSHAGVARHWREELSRRNNAK